MIHFNELRISPDFKYLIIDVSVLDDRYYENVYLDSIIIDNQDTYVNSGPSSNPVYQYTVEDKLSKLTDEYVSSKHVRLELTSQDLSLNNLLFVYVRTKGAPSADTPCGLDNITTLGTVSNMFPFYSKAMNFVGELANSCSIPQGFVDFILKDKALELALKTGNYQNAINYYNEFFKNKEGTIIEKGGCGCGNR